MRPSLLSVVAALGLDKSKISEDDSQERQSLIMEVEVDTPTGTQTFRTLLDSGAQANFLSQIMIAEMGVKSPNPNVHVRTVAGQPVRVYGKYRFDTYSTDQRNRRRKYVTNFLATDLYTY